MNALIHGAKNAFRNLVRTFSVIFILAISIGLALVMLLAYRAVSSRIEVVKSTIGNTITVNPAGSQGFQGGGEPLTTSQIDRITNTEHVTSVSATLGLRLAPDNDTTLKSAIEPGTLGNRQGQFNQRQFGGQTGDGAPPSTDGSQPQMTFTIPITGTGITDTSVLTSGSTSVTSGTVFASDSNEDIAVMGKSLAEKNSLSVGSTFTAYEATITVTGIYDAGNQFANGSLYLPLATAQRLSGQTDEISGATVYVDSISNLDTAASAIKTSLGEDKADITTNEASAKQALEPLENVRSISLYSLIGALVAGAIITLLTMLMIVRERRKEIGVLKAIGASNVRIVMQFVSESLVLTLLGGVVGAILGVFLSNPILQALVSSGTNTPTTPQIGGPGGRFLGAAQIGGGIQNFQTNLRDIQTIVSYDIVLYGLLAAVLIAIIGSAIPAWLIAKVRPAEVIRGE